MIRESARSIAGFFIALVLCAFSGIASAEIIDDIKLKRDANGEINAYIKFTVPIQHLRYFPPKKSQYLVIYFNILDSISKDQWRNYESHSFPPSGGVVTNFTATTLDLSTGPKIEIQFKQPVEFSLKAGRDGKSLHIHIKPSLPLLDQESKSVPNQSGTVITPPAALPAIAATPKTALPQGSSAITTQPSIPSGIVSKPPQPPVPFIQQQLGGKDGLPPFPVIEQPAKGSKIVPPTGDLSLADQIKKADSDAALMMAKGRDALLAGEMFAAIEAFNNTLKLPPNKYSQDAQVWIGIAREKSGQPAKAKLEYESYLKLYPNGTAAKWVKDRLAKLNAILPSTPPTVAQPAIVQHIDFQTTEYGSLSMYYYHGASHTDTTTTVGTVQTPTSLTVTDQSSLITNISMTARSYNDVYDNRLVFQDFYSANFLPGQQNTNRLSAAFYELRNRYSDYSARIGRQSALGGGVLGRFDGVSAGFGFLTNWRASAVAGRLSDQVIGSKPVFFGAGLDFGVKSSIGGQVYAIKQIVDGLVDRQAVGGNLRYFDQRKTAIALVDYDTQFKALNMVTVQGTLNSLSGTDYNFMLDRRRSPTLSIRNAVNGTTASIDTLQQNGWTIDDLLLLANQRTATTNMAQFGFTNHIQEKWQVGTDISASNTSGLPASGTLNPDFTTGLEGFVPATPSTGIAWTLSERLIGSDVISRGDVSVCSLSYSRSTSSAGTSLLFNNHTLLQEQWTLDSTLRFYWQTDDMGDKVNTIAPTLKLGYRMRNSLTLETEGGIELTKATPSSMPASNTDRKYFSLGFRWDF